MEKFWVVLYTKLMGSHYKHSKCPILMKIHVTIWLNYVFFPIMDTRSTHVCTGSGFTEFQNNQLLYCVLLNWQ